MHALSLADPAMMFTGEGLWDLCNHPFGADILSDVRGAYRTNTISRFPQQHLPALSLKRMLGDHEWQRIFTFAFVRNPWDLVVSTYHFLRSVFASQQNRASFEPDQAELMRRSEVFEDYVRLYPFVRSDMTTIIADQRGHILVDFVGRFENLPADFAFVRNTVGLDASLPHTNASHHAHYREYYTASTRDIVARHFRRDIAHFGYEF